MVNTRIFDEDNIEITPPGVPADIPEAELFEGNVIPLDRVTIGSDVINVERYRIISVQQINDNLFHIIARQIS